MYAGSSQAPISTPEGKAQAFVVARGYDAKVARGIIDALRQGGVTGHALLATVTQLAGRWEVGEDQGLEKLAAAVQQELASELGKAKVTFSCECGRAGGRVGVWGVV